MVDTTEKDVSRAFNEYSDMIYRICFMYFKNNIQDTEDAVSTTFLKYMEHGIVFENLEHEKAWLIVTAQNQCRSMLRHWWKKKVVSMESVGELEEEYIEFEISETMCEILNLPEKLRNAIYLHYYEGYTAAQIGEMFFVSESTVYSWLHKGRKKLKASLKLEL